MTFFDWCATKKIDPATISDDELPGFMKMYTRENQPDIPIIQSAPDCDGAEIQVGDLVTCTYKVTQIHRKEADPEHGLPERNSVCLSVVLPSGQERHATSCDSFWVKKQAAPLPLLMLATTPVLEMAQ